MSPSAKRSPVVALAGLAVVACGSPLPDRGVDERGSPAPAGTAGPPRLRFDPPAPPDAVTPVTRVTVEFPGALVDPRVVLVAGELTAAQLRDLARPSVPQTLASRALSALTWLEPDPSVLVVAPLVPLEPGLYTVALSAPLVSLPFTVVADTERPLLARVFPDRAELAPSARAAVWCGSDDLGPLDVAATLEPALLAGRFTLGTGSSIEAPHCVSWLAAGDLAPAGSSAPPALAPPSVTFGDDSAAALEPTLLFGVEAPSARAESCAPPEVAFGPGCALVEDDRLVLRPGDAPILWTIDCGAGSFVRATRGGSGFTLRPLPADGRCRVAVLDESGRSTVVDITLAPAPPRAHLVLNEVMANPAGPEPSQEWVELYNDGAGDVSLAGFALEDAGGRVALPDAMLAPGAFALVVPEAYASDDGVDPSPAPGTIVLRVPALGRSGLSNEGERLTLRDAAGTSVSVFPAVKTKNGVSIARVAPDAPDDDASAFVPSPNGRATPGAPNGAP